MAKKKKLEKTPAATAKATAVPALRVGDVVAVQVRIIEGNKERTQAYEGTVIKIRGADAGRSFTVRKVSRGYGIERVFPFASPAIAGIEVKRHSRVRRAKLYYLRDRTGRGAQLKERRLEAEPRPDAVET